MSPRQGRLLGGTAALALLLAGMPTRGWAQDGGPAATDGAASDVSVSDFAWLQGTWRGPGPDGGEAEIHFMEPSAGLLPGAFRLVQDGRVRVLELLTLTREEDGLHMYVRHFSPALAAMEGEHPIDLRLRERRGNRFVFENVREGNPVRSLVHRTGTDRWVATSVLARSDGSTDTIRVAYERAPGDAPDASRSPEATRGGSPTLPSSRLRRPPAPGSGRPGRPGAAR